MNKPAQLMEYIAQDIIAYIVEEQKMTLISAMHLFYTSDICEKLIDKNTGLYLEGSDYVYELLKDELHHGKIVQHEI